MDQSQWGSSASFFKFVLAYLNLISAYWTYFPTYCCYFPTWSSILAMQRLAFFFFVDFACQIFSCNCSCAMHYYYYYYYPFVLFKTKVYLKKRYYLWINITVYRHNYWHNSLFLNCRDFSHFLIIKVPMEEEEKKVNYHFKLLKWITLTSTML